MNDDRYRNFIVTYYDDKGREFQRLWTAIWVEDTTIESVIADIHRGFYSGAEFKTKQRLQIQEVKLIGKQRYFTSWFSVEVESFEQN